MEEAAEKLSGSEKMGLWLPTAPPLVARGVGGCSAWAALSRDQVEFGYRQDIVTLKSAPDGADAVRDSRYPSCKAWRGEEEQ